MEIIKPVILFHYSIPKEYLLHKKTIINLYGTVGLSKLDSKVDYSSNPFSFLNKTRKKIKITFNESS